jgi:DNA uptake protein ComE-like DNA-binding protein
MAEFIIYRGSVPFVRFSKSDAARDVASGEYRYSPLAKSTPIASEPEKETAPIIEASPIEFEESPAVGSVNLNAASLGELEALEGIGITIGKRIIDARPLRSVEDAIALSNRPDWQGLHAAELIYFGATEE